MHSIFLKENKTNLNEPLQVLIKKSEQKTQNMDVGNCIQYMVQSQLQPQHIVDFSVVRNP